MNGKIVRSAWLFSLRRAIPRKTGIQSRMMVLDKADGIVTRYAISTAKFQPRFDPRRHAASR
jgi:hypothetical protein